MQVQPTDFAHYWSNGSGRDSYVVANNGGLDRASKRPDTSLRASLYKPEQKIVLPSYVGHTTQGELSPRKSARGQPLSMAAEATLANNRADPVARARRTRQRQVSEYLHTARSSSNTMGKSARHAIQAQFAASQGLPLPAAFLATQQQHQHIPTLPSNLFSRSQGANTNNSSYGQGASSYSSGSFTARLPSRPTARKTQQQQQPQNQLGHSWDSTSLRAAMHAQTSPGFARDSAAFASPSNGALTARNQAQIDPLPLSQQPLIQSAPSAHVASPGPFQQTVRAAFDVDESAKRQAEAARASSVAEVTNANKAHIHIFDKTPLAPLPSYHITLPIGSAYLSRAAPNEPRIKDYNMLPTAGFSMTDKNRSRGIDERAYPLLA